MKKRNIVEIKVAKTDREFVGIKSKNNQATVTFPIGYNIKEEIMDAKETKKVRKVYDDVNVLMKVLEEFKDSRYKIGEDEFCYSSGIFIIENYLKKGLYNRQELQCEKNAKGKIEWKKTIQIREPIYVAGSYMYLHTDNHKIFDRECKITEIQKFCLNISFKILGWLYNYSETFDSIYKYLRKEEMIYELLKELNKVNEDGKKKLLEQMILFIKGTQTNISGNDEFEVGTYYFDKVWENLLKKQIYSLKQEKKCLPTTYYVADDKKTNSSLLPDILIEDDKKILIIDAKYYKLGALPESADICKQLFYGQYIMHCNKNCEVINMFFLPQLLNEDEFYMYGYANADHLDEKHNIFTYYLDTKSVMKDNKVIKKLLQNILN